MTNPTTNQLLWKITGNGIEQPSYIVGTHHACPSSYCNTIPGLMDALNEVHQVIGEVNLFESRQISPEEKQELSEMMQMPQGTTLETLFTSEEISGLNNFLLSITGQPLEKFSSMKPMTIMLTIQNQLLTQIIPDLENLTGMDRYLQYLAKAKNKKIGGFETMDYQMRLMYNTPLNDQAASLLEMSKQSNIRELIQKLTQTYQSQQLEKIWELFQEYWTDLEYDKIVKTRNLNWLSQIKEYLPTQPTLYVVGAGHLIGDYGLITLLQSEGYTLTIPQPQT